LFYLHFLQQQNLLLEFGLHNYQLLAIRRNLFLFLILLIILYLQNFLLVLFGLRLILETELEEKF
jgi:hypothetical protein